MILTRQKFLEYLGIINNNKKKSPNVIYRCSIGTTGKRSRETDTSDIGDNNNSNNTRR